MLNHNTSTISCLCFTNNHSHLLAGTIDGNITVTRVGNWQVEKIWEKAHKGSAILSIAVHKSGKLALSLGSDCTLRTWNLVKGRQAYVINLNSKSVDSKSLDKITWALCGIRFILSGGRHTEIWSIETGGILSTIEHLNKVTDCLWITQNSFIVGYENGQIGIVDCDTHNIKLIEGHDGRVKALKMFKNWIVSACSSGEFKVWDASLNELCKFNAGCRLMCLCLVPTTKIKKEESETQVQVEEALACNNKQINKKKKRSEVIIENDTELIIDQPVLIKKKKKDKKKIKNS